MGAAGRERPEPRGARAAGGPAPRPRDHAAPALSDLDEVDGGTGGGAATALPPPPPELSVRVLRSARRRRTVAARVVGDVLEVSIPASMSAAQEAHWVEEMRSRAERRRRADGVDLATRATELATRHDLPAPASIRWVDNQQHRWGSCTIADRSIRISSRVAGFPAWVLDYVIVHELAHLRVADHSPAFWRLVARYPLAERARGYLMARSEEP